MVLNFNIPLTFRYRKGLYICHVIKNKETMTTIKLSESDLKDFKSFVFLKPFLNQFKYCIYKKRTMKGNFEKVDVKEITWKENALDLLRFEDYLRKCCSLSVDKNILIIGEYALKLN